MLPELGEIAVMTEAGVKFPLSVDSGESELLPQAVTKSVNRSTIKIVFIYLKRTKSKKVSVCLKMRFLERRFSKRHKWCVDEMGDVQIVPTFLQQENSLPGTKLEVEISALLLGIESV